MSNFQQPNIANPDDKFTASEHLGALLLFFPTELKQGIPTVHGTADAVAARVVNLDSGRVLDDTLIFPTALVTQLKNATPDGMVLGRLGQGTAKNGNSAPWLLSPHTEQDVAKAEAWLAAHPRNSFAQPQTAPPTVAAYSAPATGGWNQQAAPAPSAPQATPAWAAPTPAAAPAVDPGLVAALAAKGINLPADATQQSAEAIWAIVGTQ